MAAPTVSVLLPTYSGSKFIGRAIKSVLSQSFGDFEFIVIDDGSRPEGAATVKEIVEEFIKKDSRIRYIRNDTNLGIQKSLNRGLRAARGAYIARIDDDDEWIDKDKLKKQTEFLETHPDCAVVGTGTIVIDENEKELFRFLGKEKDEEIKAGILRKNPFTHSSVVFRKKPALDLGGYREDEEARHVEDYDLWLRLGVSWKMTNLPFYGVRFTLREEALSARHKRVQLRRNIALIRKYGKHYGGRYAALAFSYARIFFYLLSKALPQGVRLAGFAAYKKYF